MKLMMISVVFWVQAFVPCEQVMQATFHNRWFVLFPCIEETSRSTLTKAFNLGLLYLLFICLLYT